MAGIHNRQQFCAFSILDQINYFEMILIVRLIDELGERVVKPAGFTLTFSLTGELMRGRHENLLHPAPLGLRLVKRFLSKKKKMPPGTENEQKGKVYQRMGPGDT